MLFSTKHYALAIISTFLSLGIGIFVGMNLGSDEVLSEKQKSMIDTLEADFSRLREQNIALKNQLKNTKKQLNTNIETLSDLLPFLINEKLVTRKIGIIDMSQDYVYPEVINLLQKAGAEITNVVYFNKTKNLPDFNEQEVAGCILKGVLENEGDTEHFNTLIQKNIIRITGTYSSKPDTVILAVNKLEQAYRRQLVTFIINILLDKKLSFVVVYTGEQQNFLKNASIPVINNFKNPINQINLIYTIKKINKDESR